MIKRKIIKIDENKCNGCGLCVDACHEGALQIIDGKAKLISESYCDGLGNCLPVCPQNAIIIEERLAEAYDEETVKKMMAEKEIAKLHQQEPIHFGCPGSRLRAIKRESNPTETVLNNQSQSSAGKPESQLRQWPVQIQLVPPNAPYFKNAHLLVAADCTAYAYANIHQDFMRNKITIIGCPKLDDVNYASKFTQILNYNDIKSITILRMEVPCCGGIVYAVQQALMNSGKMIPWRVVTISTEGDILED